MIDPSRAVGQLEEQRNRAECHTVSAGCGPDVAQTTRKMGTAARGGRFHLAMDYRSRWVLVDEIRSWVRLKDSVQEIQKQNRQRCKARCSRRECCGKTSRRCMCKDGVYLGVKATTGDVIVVKQRWRAAHEDAQEEAGKITMGTKQSG